MRNKKHKLSIHEVIVERVLPLLSISFLLTGCAKIEESKCPIKDPHLHLYKAKTPYGTVETYMASENITNGKYNWQENTLIVNKPTDIDFYTAKGELFDGHENWDYLFNFMKSHQDYMRYHYIRKSKSLNTTYDHLSGKYAMVTAENLVGDWTTNPNTKGLDGTIQICHYRYYGYKIELKDGKYEKIRSPLVDDIREIIDEYPYFETEPFQVVTKDYNLINDIMANLKIEDYDPFTGPDLTTDDINIK